jgi:cytochrome c biogenesis protein CcdA
MQEWIQQTLSAQQFGLAALPAVFLLGLLGAVTSCCALPVLGAVAGYAGTLSGRQDRRDLLVVGLAFMLGTVTSLAALGAFVGLVGHVAGMSLGRYWQFAAGLLMVAFGLAAAGLMPFHLPQIRIGTRARRHGVAGALVYGLAVGGASTACSVGCNPLLAVVVGATVLKGATLLGAVVFAVFALGYSLPLAAGLIGVGLGLSRLGAAARNVARVVRVGAGALLVGVGFYLLATIH